MKKYLGIIGLIAVTIIWGGGFVASDMALETLTPFQIMTIRFLIATIFMGMLAGRRISTIKKQELKSGFCLEQHYLRVLPFRSSHSSIRHPPRTHF